MKSFYQFQRIPKGVQNFFGWSVFLAMFFASTSLMSQNCNHQMVHYNLDACAAGSSYNEFSANTSKPSGISTVSATIFSNSGTHSCPIRAGGYGVCHVSEIGCSWSDNHINAFRFSVTIKPDAGKSAKISKLTFLEAAPLNYQWATGSPGDNDPPSKYGIRVLKNGQEIYQRTNIPTTHDWTTESFDFLNNPDFTVSSQTTFAFELLGYCRSNGTIGPTLWDLDEIKIFGCSESLCDNVTNGGQISGAESQCGSYNPSNMGNAQSPSGGSGALEYIWLKSTTGCPTSINQAISGATSATYNPGTITQTTWYVRCSRRVGCPDWYSGESNCIKKEVTSNTPGTTCNDGNPGTNNDQYQSDGCTCAGTPITCFGQGGDSDGDGVCDNQDCAPNNANISSPGDACNDYNAGTNNDVIQADCSCAGTPITCFGQGGDSDGDGVCDNQDCAPNNANISSPGDACNDYNANTNNDVIQADCSCAGTPVTSGCNATWSVNGCTITVNGLTDPVTQVQITNAAWTTIFECNSWGGSACGSSVSFDVPSNGTYNLFIKTYSAGWTNICNILETVNVTSCGNNNPCAGQGGDSDGDGVCNNQDCAPNNANISSPGDACNDYNANTTNDVIQADCSCAGTPVNNPCAGQGGDSDGDGVCNNQDCAPNNPNISSPGDACNDGNANTNNDVIQSDCSCAGTPVGNNSCDATWAVNGRTISVSDLNNPVEQVQILDAGFNEVFSCNSWTGGSDCGSNISYTAPSNGTYYLFIKTYTASWSNICNVFETIQIGGGTNPVCSVSASVSNIQCQNNGTATASDDTYSFDVTATITNGGAWGYTVVGTNVDHQANGSTGTVTGMMISAGARTFTVIDADDPNCMTTISVTPPAACSTGNPCAGQGGDSDGDGVCDNQDCAPHNANISSPGDACNDGNANTTNDVIQADCSCAGTPVTGGTCDASISANGLTVTVSGLTNPITDVRIVDAAWQPVASCNSYGGTPCGTTATLTVPSSGTYYITIKTYSTDWLTTYCNIFETLNLTGGNTGGCNNVTSGGQIAGDQSMSGGYNPSTITNTESPTGGSGAIEYIWLSSTTGCPNALSQQIPGATGATYDPGPITQTTYYRRCARRAGCTGNNSFLQGESNCVVKEVTAGNSICADRQVINSNSACGAGQGYGFYAQNFIFGAGGVNIHYDFQNGSFVEYTDGTARLTGTAVNWDNSNIIWDIDFTFTGRTSTAPVGSPKGSNCGNYTPNPADFYYYTASAGMATGHGMIAGAKINVTRDGEAFQVGTGANGNDAWNFGASGWFSYTIVSQPNNSAITLQNGVRMDINIRLSGTSAMCMPNNNRQQFGGLDATVNHAAVDVTWTNNEGFKTDYFEIQRSVDGQTWETVGEVAAATDSNDPKFYLSKDKLPLAGANFYRLIINYMDGSFEISEIKRVTIADVEDFGLFPNPALENVNVSLKGYEGLDIEIRIIDNFGKQLKAIQLNDVSDSTYEVSLDGVQNGMYSLWIFADNRKPIGKKVIVSKRY